MRNMKKMRKAAVCCDGGVSAGMFTTSLGQQLPSPRLPRSAAFGAVSSARRLPNWSSREGLDAGPLFFGLLFLPVMLITSNAPNMDARSSFHSGYKVG
ncbi:hypothetical protein [Paenibacillus darwinianus]|uniref:hypothetical protein n=1 Tax=Paenibacillus darwinianus TaxID=1380763 RepID=UPI0016802842|nr:hypothetical protein [Paenibacillus darwinianus]